MPPTKYPNCQTEVKLGPINQIILSIVATASMLYIVHIPKIELETYPPFVIQFAEQEAGLLHDGGGARPVPADG